MKKLVCLICMIALLRAGFAQGGGTGEIIGVITDESSEPALAATVKLLSGSILVKQTVPDMNGKYCFKPLQPGIYEVVISQEGYVTQRIPNIEVESEKATFADAELKIKSLDVFVKEEIVEWKKPLVDPSYITIHSLTIDQIEKMPVTKNDVIGMISNSTSEIIVSEDGQDIHSRGTREGTTAFYADGERLPFSNNVVGMGIQSLAVITGGIPAQYGDLTGAAVVITSKDYFTALARKRMQDNKKKEALLIKKNEEELQKQKKERSKIVLPEENQ